MRVEYSALFEISRRCRGSSQISELAAHTRVVLVNQRISGIPCVLIDSGAGVRHAVDHLVEYGHRVIAYVAGPRSSWSNQQRRRAVRERTQAKGVELELRGPSYRASGPARVLWVGGFLAHHSSNHGGWLHCVTYADTDRASTAPAVAGWSPVAAWASWSFLAVHFDLRS